MKHFLLAVLTLVAVGCAEPSMPNIPQGCRTFYVTTWHGGPGWSELDWNTQVYAIDEPFWNYQKMEVYPLETWPAIAQSVNDRFYAAKQAGKTTWINYSYPEIYYFYYRPDQMTHPVEIESDVVSFDWYVGSDGWGSWYGLQYFTYTVPDWLELVSSKLRPGQMLGLVPEAFTAPKELGKLQFDEHELILTNALYLDWAMRHQTIVYAYAPWAYHLTGGWSGMDQFPGLEAFVTNFQTTRPLCP